MHCDETDSWSGLRITKYWLLRSYFWNVELPYMCSVFVAVIFVTQFLVVFISLTKFCQFLSSSLSIWWKLIYFGQRTFLFSSLSTKNRQEFSCVKLHDLILVEPETLNLDLLIYLVMFLWPKIFTHCKKSYQTTADWSTQVTYLLVTYLHSCLSLC